MNRERLKLFVLFLLAVTGVFTDNVLKEYKIIIPFSFSIFMTMIAVSLVSCPDYIMNDNKINYPKLILLSAIFAIITKLIL